MLPPMTSNDDQNRKSRPRGGGNSAASSAVEAGCSTELPVAATEVNAATDYLVRALVSGGLIEAQASTFGKHLRTLLAAKVDRDASWLPDEPHRGSSLRVLRTEPGRFDGLMAAAATAAAINVTAVVAALPSSFAVWVDPGDVCVRIGNGTVQRLLYVPNNTVMALNSPKHAATVSELSASARTFAPSPPAKKRTLSVDADVWNSPTSSPWGSPASSPVLSAQGPLNLHEYPTQQHEPRMIGIGWPMSTGLSAPISAPPVPVGAVGWAGY